MEKVSYLMLRIGGTIAIAGTVVLLILKKFTVLSPGKALFGTIVGGGVLIVAIGFIILAVLKWRKNPPT